MKALPSSIGVRATASVRAQTGGFHEEVPVEADGIVHEPPHGSHGRAILQEATGGVPKELLVSVERQVHPN